MSSTIYNYLNDFPVVSNCHMKLEDPIISRFKLAKEFTDRGAQQVSSIDFSRDGLKMITSSPAEGNLISYDCRDGCRGVQNQIKKYGVGLVKYTHDPRAALHTSTKGNHGIRLITLHDNHYKRYFMGHEDKVTTIAMSPEDDTFLSASLDHTVKLWDFRLENAIASLSARAPVCANYDPQGLMFAVGINSDTIKLFDLRKYTDGPYSTVTLDKPPAKLKWTSLKFSPNGKQILITSNLERLFILDSLTCRRLQTLETSISPNPNAEQNFSPEACYTPDASFILCGSMDGMIYVWDANGFKLVKRLRPGKEGVIDPVQFVSFNPKYMIMASASSKLSFWTPNLDEI